jgi:hypothetical protein
MRKRIPPHRDGVTENLHSLARCCETSGVNLLFSLLHSQCSMCYVRTQLRLLYVHHSVLTAHSQLEGGTGRSTWQPRKTHPRMGKPRAADAP